MRMIGKHVFGMILSLMAMLVIASGIQASEKTAPAKASKETPKTAITYDDPLGRSTPQGTVVGFLKAMERENSERAVDYLDTQQTGKRAHELALELQQVLDRLSVSATALSSKPDGDLQDGLPINREVVGVFKTKKGEQKILLDRVQKENNPPIWLFSSETLKLVPQISEDIDSPWLERHLPAILTETRLAGQPLYRWIMYLLMLPLAVLIGWLCVTLLFAVSQKRLRRYVDEPVLMTLKKIRIPLVLLFSAGTIYILSLGTVSLLGRLFLKFLSSTAAVASLTWIFIHLIEVGAEIVEKRRLEASNAIIRLSATLLKFVTVVVGLVVVFYYFAGINLTAVVAGLGVGGIAVAFAAQKTIENFFGGIFLVWDKPIRLGDFCKAGDNQGTVEHIGIRSTQIRTLDRTVIFIPNGQLSSISVENFTLRDRFLFRHTINLRYETTADQLRDLLAQLRDLLCRHPQVDSLTVRVRFVAFGQSSLNVEIFAYIIETAQEAFLAVQEDLLLCIMDLVESFGIGFAFPSRTLYLEKDGGLHEEKSREAAKGRAKPERPS